MNKSARLKKSLVTTATAVGTLWCGCMARRGRLYSDKSRFGYAGTCQHHRARTGQPLGYIPHCHEPFLDFEPGYQYSHSLRGDGRQ